MNVRTVIDYYEAIDFSFLLGFLYFEIICFFFFLLPVHPTSNFFPIVSRGKINIFDLFQHDAT